MWDNQFFWKALRNTFTLGVISTVPQLLMALGMAHLLNYKLRGRTFFRITMLLPYATSLAAATIIFTELAGREVQGRMLNPRPVRAGEVMDFVLDLTRLHLFDKASGRSLRA